jgi:hypothetical protein
MRNRYARLAGPLLAATALGSLAAGCASTESLTQSKGAVERAEALSQLASQPMTPADVSPIKVRDAAYVGATVARNERGDPLPNGWERRRFPWARAGNVGFQQVAHAVTKITGIPVAVTAINSGSQVNTTQQVQARPGGNDFESALGALGQGGPGQPGSLSIQTIRASESPTGDLGIQGSMAANFDGPLPEFLDLVATNFNVAWEFKDNRLVFQRYITRTFDVAALPGVTELSFGFKSGGDSASASGGGGQTAGGTSSADQVAATKAVFDTWKDIDDTLKGIMAREGGLVQSSPNKGMVTVTASPAAVRHVQDYLKKLNDQLTKQVAINVKVYSVVLNDGDNFSSDINLLLQDRGPGGVIRSAVAISSGGAASGGRPGIIADKQTGLLPVQAGLNVVQSGNNQGVGWAILGNGRAAGSNGVANLLSQKGDVSVVTSASQIAHNGQPVPVQVSNTRGYAKQVSTVAGTLGSGTQTSITPGSVTTGFNLHLVPRIQRDGTVMLQYGLNVSELVGSDNGFDTFTTGGQTIQLPNVNARNFIQQATIPNANTLVLAGFEQVRASTVKQGQGQSWLWPVGGVSNSQLRREILVVAITPTIVDAKAPASGVSAQPAQVASGL